LTQLDAITFAYGHGGFHTRVVKTNYRNLTYYWAIVNNLLRLTRYGQV
jgi:hypothetical protein